MGAPVDAVDQQVMAVIIFVGDPAHDDATDDRRRALGRGIIDDAIGRRAFEVPGSQLALHRADDVAALADPAQGVGKIGLEPPRVATNMRGKAHPSELLQPADAQRLLEGIMVAGADELRRADVTDQPPVDHRQPFVVHVAA